MEGFGLLIGHLVGDYILQNDWQAKNKTNPHPGKCPISKGFDLQFPCAGDDPELQAAIQYDETMRRWRDANKNWWIGNLACFIHCLCYTLAVWAFSFWWMPWWGLLVCFVVHFPVDRWCLASVWMKNVSGQKAFATGPLSPWSIIVVDNIWHLLTLYGIAVVAGWLSR